MSTRLLTWILTALLLAGPAAARPALPTGEWTAPRGDHWNRAAARVRSADNATPRTWTRVAPPQVRGYEPGMAVWSSAAVGTVGSRAVVAVGCHDHGVYLLDAVSGETVWRYVTGGGVYSAPLIWRDNGKTRVLAASSDRSVYSIDAATGRREWARAVSKYRPTLGGARLSAPCLGKVRDRSAVFIGHWVFDKSLGHSLQRGGLTALDARTGEPLWQVAFLDNRVSAPLFAELGGRGRVFVASDDGNLRAFDADSGNELWSDRQTEPVQGTPALVHTADGPLVIIGGHFGTVRALDASSGELRWAHKAGNWVTASPAVMRTPDRDLVVVGSYDNRVLALDTESGEPVWRHTAGGPPYASAAVVPGEEPKVVFAAYDHHLYGASSRGDLLFRVYTGAPMWSGVILGESPWASPTVAEVNGRWMAYFGSYSGTLFAIPLNEAALVGPSQPWSNTSFFGTMLAALAATALTGLYLTRRSRRR